MTTKSQHLRNGTGKRLDNGWSVETIRKRDCIVRLEESRYFRRYTYGTQRELLMDDDRGGSGIEAQALGLLLSYDMK